ncbi:hypothetical protein B0T16DRAFT_321920 [Cercophora newfieldiana]|uniref:Galactose oxidase n=1 Tax=Cercophora newfieldiana TaxID=92897 RepID=A0AA39YED3_9PEZI|nr:hypothetical protein B0T16DRAFT_321920 [Cercophora newfieldiana]
MASSKTESVAKTSGRWSEPFELPNVAVHASLLPNGKILHWGRRENPKSTDLASLDEHFTKAFVWDPVSKKSTPTANEPRDINGKTVNLFCSGHAFLPDGALLIAGGHLQDGWGITSACIFDATTNTFVPKTPFARGRWYPSVLTLPDGRMLVVSGSFEEGSTVQNNNISEIWPSNTGAANPPRWTEVADPLSHQGPVFPLYPHMHVAPTGRVVIVGPLAQSWWLDIKDQATGQDWVDAGTARKAMMRDYCPSVMYDTGKIMFIGGGMSDQEAGPTNEVEFLDVNGAKAKWTSSAATNMKIGRRQFNATVLPDGSVFVNGGTKGAGFNDLSPAAHILESELWDPATGKWSQMASESINRCYHGTSLLLPDGRVFSAGSGEYGGAPPDQCHTNGQLFEPPYLHKGGSRPAIKDAPTEIVYGKDFSVTLGSQVDIQKISWVRLGSVTHCRNMNQSLMFLRGFRQSGTHLTIPAPANGNLAPPGHYMLFVLDKRGVPSVARIIRITSTASPPPPEPNPHTPHQSPYKPFKPSQGRPGPCVQPTLHDQMRQIRTSQNHPAIAIGLTPLCPYGLGPCWGGAYDALCRISNIDLVSPTPNQNDSLAFVYMKEENSLPDIDAWRKEFAATANSSYEIRGIEVTVSGVVQRGDGKVDLKRGVGLAKKVTLAPFTQKSQLKWDVQAGAARAVTVEETGAYQKLIEALGRRKAGLDVSVLLTGTLQKQGGGVFSLDVRKFEMTDGPEE